MNKITRAWTYGVAYLSLAVGSGVSISGNIADTYRVATAIGRHPDSLDIAISAFWPAAVLLAIEMFVSRLWPRTTAMQAVRWAGSIGIGFVAMYVSWHHLDDLLSSRGQDVVVSNIGPLAIDGLAIMATGLILSSRGHKIEDGPSLMDKFGAVVDTLATGQNYVATEADVAESEAAFRGQLDTAKDPFAEWESELDDLDLDLDVASATHPVSAPPAALSRSNEIKPDSVPNDAVVLLSAWSVTALEDRPRPGERDILISEAFDVSPRTARRWYTALVKA
jgi:hypothetical protein